MLRDEMVQELRRRVQAFPIECACQCSTAFETGFLVHNKETILVIYYRSLVW